MSTAFFGKTPAFTIENTEGTSTEFLTKSYIYLPIPQKETKHFAQRISLKFHVVHKIFIFTRNGLAKPEPKCYDESVVGFVPAANTYYL